MESCLTCDTVYFLTNFEGEPADFTCPFVLRKIPTTGLLYLQFHVKLTPHIAECSNFNSKFCLQATIAGCSIDAVNIVLCPFTFHRRAVQKN